MFGRTVSLSVITKYTILAPPFSSYGVLIVLRIVQLFHDESRYNPTVRFLVGQLLKRRLLRVTRLSRDGDQWAKSQSKSEIPSESCGGATVLLLR